MGFAERAESWRAKAHLTGGRPPGLVGGTALAAIVLIAAGGALVKAGTSDGFSLSRDDGAATSDGTDAVSYTHLRAHETGRNLVCRLLLEKKKTHVAKKSNC